MDELIDELMERGVKLALKYGVDEAEIYGFRETSTTFKGTYRGVEDVVSGDKVVIGVRVVTGRKVITQGGMVSKAEDVDVILERATKMVRTLPDDPNWVSLPKKLGTSNSAVVDGRVRDPDINYFIEVLHYLINGASNVDRHAFTSDATIRLSYYERFITNTYGEKLRECGTKALVSVSVKAVDSGGESGYNEYYYSPTLNRFNPDQLIIKAVETAVKTLHGRRVETGTYEIILTPKVFTSLIESLIIPALCADQVQKGRSKLKGCLGRQIFHEGLTIIDDGTYPEMVGSKGFDDEGVQTRRKYLVDKGVLKNYLYDNYTANIDGRESTGNARRPTPYQSPSPWASNILVEAGTEDVINLVSNVRRGLLVYDVIGMWLSNPVNGLLNATVTNSVFIEGGVEKFSVKGVIIAGNIYELLKHEGIALTSKTEDYGAYKIPHIYIPKALIAGT
ncbi:MAG: TldD/PmbA family protein [Sulfolobales archaeon]